MLKGIIQNKKIWKINEEQEDDFNFEINSEIVIPQLKHFNQCINCLKYNFFILFTSLGCWKIYFTSKDKVKKLENFYHYMLSTNFKLLIRPLKQQHKSYFIVDHFRTFLKKNNFHFDYISSFVFNKKNIELNLKIHKDFFVIANAIIL